MGGPLKEENTGVLPRLRTWEGGLVHGDLWEPERLWAHPREAFLIKVRRAGREQKHGVFDLSLECRLRVGQWPFPRPDLRQIEIKQSA